MVLMGGVGLLFALATVNERRKRDYPETTADTSLNRVIVVAPARLAALGFLPSERNVLVGLHVAELLAEPSGEALIAALRSNKPNSEFGGLEQWTGLKLEQIDHLVLGSRLEDRFPPHVVLVVRTRQPYDAAKVRATLQAGRPQLRAGRTVYRFDLKGIPFGAAVWFADEQTLVFGLSAEDLDAVPKTPEPGAERLPASLRQFLTDRLPAGTPIWAVADARDWKTGPLLSVLGGASRETTSLLNKLRIAGTWVQTDAEIAWHLQIEEADPEAAKELQQYLAEDGLAPGKSWKFLEERPQTERLAQELSKTLTRERKENWLSLRAKVSREAIREALTTVR
jgi:hypothetical protein